MRGRIKRENPAPSRVPIIGKVKCGMTVAAKSRDGKSYQRPTSLDYFIPFKSKYDGLFSQALGEKPHTITVVFISDEVGEVCDERFELRDSGGRLFGKGDGETFDIWDSAREEYRTFLKSEHPDIMERSAAKAGKPWKVVLELRFIIPEIRGVIGQWQLTTRGAASSIPAIRDAFDFVQARAGTVVNVPFDLHVEKVTSQKPGSSSTYPVITLVPNISQGHLETVRRFAELGVSTHRLLTEEAIEELEDATPRQLTASVVVDVDAVEDEDLFVG